MPLPLVLGTITVTHCMMMQHKVFHYFIQFQKMLLGLVLLSGLVACQPQHRIPVQDAFIENTEGGMEVLDREFGEDYQCDEGELHDDNTPTFVYQRPAMTGLAGQRQQEIESQFPHTFPSLGQMYPNRGTWRQTKEEVLDLVDRHIWSPEENRVVRLLHYFDMVLLMNVAPRLEGASEDLSAQRMQVLIRRNNSNNLQDWQRLHTWPISSGIPCGRRIATFTGVYKFNPQRMYSSYSSNLWDGVDMYESMFLYHNYRNGNPTGVAIHGTYLTERLGYRDSGGCVRLYRDNSQCLFSTITGGNSRGCLGGGQTDYYGKVPSFLPTQGEADPEYLRSGNLEVDGYRVLIVIYNQEDDRL
jgi:hypothetical protein